MKINDLYLVLEDTVALMTASSCNKYLVVADCVSNIAVWENRNDKWFTYCKLPKYSCIPTSVGIHPKRLHLVVAYADQKVRCNLDCLLSLVKVICFR